jgi:uncharacterized protein GlcG (DUF336 family)
LHDGIDCGASGSLLGWATQTNTIVQWRSTEPADSITAAIPMQEFEMSRAAVSLDLNKAWTARAFDASTEDLAHLTQSGQPGFGLNTTNDSRVVIFGGGIPIKMDGVVIGAVGASGGSVEQDVAVARAAASGFQRSLQ